MTVLNHQGEIIEVDAAGSLRSLETLGAEGGSQVYIEAGEDIETLADHLASIEIVMRSTPHSLMADPIPRPASAAHL